MSRLSTMMGNSQEHRSLTGEKVRADGWYGHRDGLHTVVIQVTNFTGRIHIEASLSLDPTDDDWFEIPLTEETNYLQFPFNPLIPTGNNGVGDTLTKGFSFKVNALWLRARMDREYISDTIFFDLPELLAQYGSVTKISLAR